VLGVRLEVKRRKARLVSSEITRVRYSTINSAEFHCHSYSDNFNSEYTMKNVRIDTNSKNTRHVDQCVSKRENFLVQNKTMTNVYGKSQRIFTVWAIYIYIYIYIHIHTYIHTHTHTHTHTQKPRYGMEGPALEMRWGRDIFWKQHDRPLGPPSILYYGKRFYFPWEKSQGLGAGHLPRCMTGTEMGIATPHPRVWACLECNRTAFQFMYYTYAYVHLHIFIYVHTCT
jgi:hypothetical protein